MKKYIMTHIGKNGRLFQLIPLGVAAVRHHINSPLMYDIWITVRTVKA